MFTVDSLNFSSSSLHQTRTEQTLQIRANSRRLAEPVALDPVGDDVGGELYHVDEDADVGRPRLGPRVLALVVLLVDLGQGAIGQEVLGQEHEEEAAVGHVARVELHAGENGAGGRLVERRSAEFHRIYNKAKSEIKENAHQKQSHDQRQKIPTSRIEMKN